MKAVGITILWMLIGNPCATQQEETFVSTQITLEEFMKEQSTARIFKNGNNFEFDDIFEIQPQQEIVLYQYSRSAHPHGVLVVEYSGILSPTIPVTL